MSSRLLTTAASTRRLHRMDDGARQTTRPRKRLTGIARPAPDAPAGGMDGARAGRLGLRIGRPCGRGVSGRQERGLKSQCQPTRQQNRLLMRDGA